MNNNYPKISGTSLKQCFVLYHIFTIVSHVNVLAMNSKDVGDELNSNILKGQFCSEIFNDNPCAKDILKLFVNQINENRNEIQLLKQRDEKNINEIQLLKQRLEKLEKIELSEKSRPVTNDFSSQLNYDVNLKHIVNDHMQDENVHVRIDHVISIFIFT